MRHKHLIPNRSAMWKVSLIVFCLFWETWSQSCQPNVNNCRECQDATACKSCLTGYFLNPSKTCQKCPVGCSACSSSSSCSACQPTFEKQANQCTCPYKRGVNSTSGRCVTCSVNQCIRCPNNYSYCNYCDGYWGAKSGQCLRCNDPKCWDCNPNFPYCRTCIEGYGRNRTNTAPCVPC